MNPMEVISEYLVKLSADVDTGSFNAAMSAINELVGALKKVKGLAVVGAAASGFVAIGKAAMDTVKNVAAADMQFKRLANQMWVTKETAKSLSTAMKVMGVSEEDIAWIPELREQFFRLHGEMNALATPVDADRQLRWIRQIGYDVQSLQVKLKMLKEWVAYYLIKYLQPFIKEFQNFINWLNDKLAKNMPAIARRIAEVLGHIVSVGLSAMKVVKMALGAIYRFGESLPSNVKRWGAVFATVGAFILAGPFGKFIIALGGALVLLEDFIYYMNGWKSSKAMAPVWEKLLQFLEGGTLTRVGEVVKKILSETADLLDDIIDKLKTITEDFITGFDWEGIKDSWSDGLSELAKGVGELFNAVADLFDKIFSSTDEKSKSRQHSFWKSIGTFISDALKDLGRFAGMMGKIVAALALVFRGDFEGAARLLGVIISEGAKKTPWGRLIGAAGNLLSGDEEQNTKEVGNALISKFGFSRAGAAGALGNFSAESNVDPSAVQNSWLHWGYLDRIKNGGMSEEEFANDGVGFGIAQWTDPGRKRALWEYAAQTGRSIDDLGMQVEFFVKELQENYPDLYNKLRSGEITVEEASNAMLHDFEAPADQSESVEYARASRSQSAYDTIGDIESGASTPPGDSLVGSSSNSFAGSYASRFISTGVGFAATPASYSSRDSHNFTVGAINVNVAGSNATPEDIGRGIAKVLNAGFGGGWSV